MSDSWLWMSAADLGRGIAAGAIDPRELAEVYLAALDAHPEAQAIYARLTPDRARAQADAARARAGAGTRRGPLDGVPVSWKDLFDTAGTPTEAGSALLSGRVPGRDARVVARGARAGLVALGKTHMTELAFSGLGVNPVTATPPNINDPELAPGGSSSGAAASVAFGLAAAGIGSDTGGSVRVPAAWNDLVGLKTTHGAIPLEGVVPLCASLDTIGPLARTVEDAALLHALLTAAPPADLAGATLAGTRLHLLEDAEGIGGAAPEVEAGFNAAVERLAAAGAVLTRGPLPLAAAVLAHSVPLYTVEAYGTWGEAIEADPEAMFHQIRTRFRLGRDYSGPDYVRALRAVGEAQAGYAAETAGYDAVLLPTTPNLPPRVDRLLAEDAYYARENMLTLRNSRIANMLGLCALTLPSGTPSVGLMAMAQGGRDRALLRLGAAMEAALA